jgi:beta-glucosidase/6-phospho-beta-glucosidase/beta-galactosidase
LRARHSARHDSLHRAPARHLRTLNREIRNVVTMPAAPPLELDDGFVVATGFECSAPVVRGGIRQDELKKTGHWERYAEDYGLAASFGIRYVRFGVPFHVVAPSDRPTDFDWRWTDLALAALRDEGLEPILDLLHFGLPDDISAVADPRLVKRFEVFAREVAERYPWARYYTPVNEPLVTAVLSAEAGLWNERKRDQRAFVAAIDSLVTCAVRGMEIIRDRRPDAIFLQSDACSSYQALDEASEERARFLNEQGFVCWDLTYGRRPAGQIVRWLTSNGMSEQRLDWFAQHGTDAGCIVGHDYYRGNEWIVGLATKPRRAGSRRRGYLALAREYSARYGLPFMISETNIAGSLAPRWLAEMWNDALTLRAEGAPIRGITWYGFVDHVDWDSGLVRNRGHVNRCGLVGLDRKPHRVGRLYRDLALAALAGRFEPLSISTRGARPLDAAA